MFKANWVCRIIVFLVNIFYLILILCSFSLKPNISLRTPDRADKITTFTVVYRYGLALSPDILNGDSSSLSRSAANLRTELATISSSFFCGFCSIWRYRLICSVINTERLRYFRLILVPNVMKRSRKQPRQHDQINASRLYWDCRCTESYDNVG